MAKTIEFKCHPEDPNKLRCNVCEDDKLETEYINSPLNEEKDWICKDCKKSLVLIKYLYDKSDCFKKVIKNNIKYLKNNLTNNKN